MHIAIVTENFLPKVDGVTRTLARLLEHLQAGGHRVAVFGPESGMETYAGAELYGTAGIPFLPYPELKLNLWRPEFTRKLVEFEPHVIHLVDPVWLGAAALAICHTKLQDIPVVSSYHTNLATYCGHFGLGIFTPLMWRWNLFCHSRCRYTVCPSPSTRDMLEYHEFQNVRLWPRGVDTTLFSPRHRSCSLRAEWTGQPDTPKTILLYVGRLSYEKNIGLVVDAYKQLDHARCHLVLVGHGPAHNDIKAECERLEIPVTFTGYLQGTELATAFSSADLFVFPSTTETFGQVVLEAMSSGLPVVGLVAEGVRDLVDHRKTGLLLDTTGLTVKEQAKHYKANIITLINDIPLRTVMSNNAIKSASRYSWWEAMECMVQVYRDATEEARLKHTMLDIDNQQINKHSVDERGDSGVEEGFSEEELDDLDRAEAGKSKPIEPLL